MTGAFVTPFHFLFLSCLLASLLTVVSTAVLLFVPLVLIEVPELVAVPLASAINKFYSTYSSSSSHSSRDSVCSDHNCSASTDFFCAMSSIDRFN